MILMAIDLIVEGYCFFQMGCLQVVVIMSMYRGVN